MPPVGSVAPAHVEKHISGISALDGRLGVPAKLEGRVDVEGDGTMVQSKVEFRAVLQDEGLEVISAGVQGHGGAAAGPQRTIGVGRKVCRGAGRHVDPGALLVQKGG